MPAKGDAPVLPGARAVARHVRISPMKARRVVNLVRGLPAKEALTVLQFAPQAASEQVYKVLASAIANAENNERLDPDALLVSEAFVDEGPTLKRFRPRAQGRAYRIRKRTCHITIVVEAVAPASAEEGRGEEGRPGHGRAGHRGRRSAEQDGGRRVMGQKVHPHWVPARHLDRLEVPLVRGQALQGLHRRGCQDPPHDVQGPRARRHLQGRHRAHPRPGPRRHPHRPAGHRHRP